MSAVRVLVTGAAGVVGSETARLLAGRDGIELTLAVRMPREPGQVGWSMGAQPPPAELAGPWDVIVHTAASTRWTMTREEAVTANVGPTLAVLGLAGEGTHVVHVSTAYADGREPDETFPPSEFGRYRNAYEWSKARCERLVLERHRGPVTVVRPPLILGRRSDGAIARFSGPYTLLQTLVSGLAAAVVGDPDGYAEIAPVDQVAEVIAGAALGDPPDTPATEVIAAGDATLRLAALVDVICGTLNEVRAAAGACPIVAPPFIATERWHRFFLPLARRHLSPVQSQAVELLGMFESYTSMPKPFTPTRPVLDPASVLAESVRWWARTRPRLALRTPEPWGLVG
ncbi:SDR family oxidoreductase [Microbispora hainanensis]|uniref:SDR family oxidoreductase n=1 Tax=Microbispora hainanensis TaxID=568844 RepID=UPI0033D7CA40